MKAVVAAFNQEKALVGAFSVIVHPIVEPMDRFAALAGILDPGSEICSVLPNKAEGSPPTPATAMYSLEHKDQAHTATAWPGEKKV